MNQYSRGGFQSRYRCPACGEVIQTGDARKRLGPFIAHPTCEVGCGICEEPISLPPIGQAYMVGVLNGSPVHDRCKHPKETS